MRVFCNLTMRLSVCVPQLPVAPPPPPCLPLHVCMLEQRGGRTVKATFVRDCATMQTSNQVAGPEPSHTASKPQILPAKRSCFVHFCQSPKSLQHGRLRSESTAQKQHKMCRTKLLHMALSMPRQTQPERISEWVMFIQDCIPISAVNRLLLRSAFPDENHMFTGALHLRHTDYTPPLPRSNLTPRADDPEGQESRGMAAESSLFSRQAQRPWPNILREECLESSFRKQILSESSSLS